MEGKTNTWLIIKNAIKLTWKNKLFWLLGIFAFLISPIGEIESILVKGFNAGQPGILSELGKIIIDSKILTLTGLKGLAVAIVKQPVFTLTVLISLVVILIIAAIIIWLAVVCQNTLIYKTALLDKGVKTNKTLFNKAGFKKFWPVLTLDLIFKALAAFLFFIIGLLLAKNFLMLAILFVIFSLIIITISFITKLTIMGIVLENLALTDALKQGFQLLASHWFAWIKLMFSLLLINIILVLLLGLATLIAQILISITIATAVLLGLAAGFLLSIKLLIAIVLILGILTLAFSTTIHWVAWTLLFVRLKSRKV